ncbi:hypothetical protein J4214_02415 [Candidatus Woesearchaeota archaeon]|nr:hypothetical protein [Candidatus Woesearchaeota archaeon]
MESKQNAQKKMKQIRRNQKVYGVPKLPQKIDAMYDNICRGNLVAYYLDADPVREDPVYLKLKKLKATYSWDSPNGSERFAQHLMFDMVARQMREKTYYHIRKTPLWLLKFEFGVRHETNRELRREIDRRLEYMFRNEDKEWLDYKLYK